MRRNGERILVIAPHPDDEVLGCGGTVARHVREGNEVYLLIVTKGYPPDWSEEFLKNRPKEIKKANKILGIKKTFFLDFPAARLDTIPQRNLNDSILKVINEIKPTIVYIPHKGDLHKDHRIIFESSLVALRPFYNNVKKILSFETLSETEWGFPIEYFYPNVYVDISDTIDLKIKAFNQYRDEIKEYPHPRSVEGIEALAKKRGSEVNFKYAEAFYLVRELVSEEYR